jgi:hypothetical protein
VDLGPERVGQGEGWGPCRRRPPPPGGESTDDYAGATTCELGAAVARVHFPVDRPADAALAIRLAPRPAAGDKPRLTVVVNGRALAPAALDPGWHELRFDAPAPWWRAGRNEVELRVEAPGGAAPPLGDVDHVLAIPR